MKELREHLETLWNPSRWLSWQRVSDKVAALRAIAQIGRPRDAGSVFHLTLLGNPVIAAEAAETVRQLMLKTRPAEWTQLYPSFQHVSVASHQMGRLAGFGGDAAVYLLGVASLNGSGYVREAALSALGQIGAPQSLPFVLLRLADWVGPVRQRAHEALKLVLPVVTVREVVRHYHLVDRLVRAERVDLSHIWAEIADWLRAPERRAELTACSDDAELKERLFCWRVREPELRECPELADELVADRLVDIRLWALRHIDWARQPGERLTRLLQDKASRVRFRALRAFPEAAWHKVQGAVFESLFDPAPGPRALARFLLSKHGDKNLGEHYRERVGAGSPVEAGAIAGLGETGNKSDFELVEPFVGDPKPKVRAAALSALSKLRPEESGDHVVAGLSDASSNVRKACVRILTRKRDLSIRDKVRGVLRRGTPDGQRASLRVIVWYGGLDGLADLLLALCDGNQELRDAATVHVATWLADYLATPWSLRYSREWIPEVKKQAVRCREAGRSQVPWQEIEHVIAAVEAQT